ncbi:MAG: hypothetical protein RR316_03250, partial [Clostridia bacterium]
NDGATALKDVTCDLYLPTSIKSLNANIDWHSSNKNIINDNGVSGTESGEVELIATIRINNEIFTQSFKFNFIKQNNDTRFQYLLSKIGTIKLSSLYDWSATSPTPPSYSTSHFDLPTLLNYKDFDYDKVASGTQGCVDLGLSKIEYTISTNYTYVGGGYLGSNNTDKYYYRVTLNTPTFSRYAEVKVVGKFSDEDASMPMHEGVVKVLIDLGDKGGLYDKVAEYLQGELNKIDVLRNILDVRSGINPFDKTPITEQTKKGALNENGDFLMPTEYLGFFIEYIFDNKIADVEMKDVTTKQVYDNKGKVWDDATSIGDKYYKIQPTLINLKEYDSRAAVTVRITLPGDTVGTNHDYTLYFDLPGAIHNNEIGIADFEIFYNVKLQIIQQLPNGEVSDKDIIFTNTVNPETNVAHFVTSTKWNYILLRDIAYCKALVFEYGTNEIVLDTDFDRLIVWAKEVTANPSKITIGTVIIDIANDGKETISETERNTILSYGEFKGYNSGDSKFRDLFYDERHNLPIIGSNAALHIADNSLSDFNPSSPLTDVDYLKNHLNSITKPENGYTELNDFWFDCLCEWAQQSIESSLTFVSWLTNKKGLTEDIMPSQIKNSSLLKEIKSSNGMACTASEKLVIKEYLQNLMNYTTAAIAIDLITDNSQDLSSIKSAVKKDLTNKLIAIYDSIITWATTSTSAPLTDSFTNFSSLFTTKVPTAPVSKSNYPFYQFDYDGVNKYQSDGKKEISQKEEECLLNFTNSWGIKAKFKFAWDKVIYPEDNTLSLVDIQKLNTLITLYSPPISQNITLDKKTISDVNVGVVNSSDTIHNVVDTTKYYPLNQLLYYKINGIKKSISGLKFFINLEYLAINGNIDNNMFNGDIKADELFKALTATNTTITHLEMQFTELTDITSIKLLKSITYLDLSCNSVLSDIRGISNMNLSILKFLDVSNTSAKVSAANVVGIVGSDNGKVNVNGVEIDRGKEFSGDDVGILENAYFNYVKAHSPETPQYIVNKTGTPNSRVLFTPNITADPYKTDLMYLYYLKEISTLNSLDLQLPTIVVIGETSIEITWMPTSDTITNGVKYKIQQANIGGIIYKRLIIKFTAPQPDLITGRIYIQAKIKNDTSVAIRIFTIDVNIKKQP